MTRRSIFNLFGLLPLSKAVPATVAATDPDEWQTYKCIHCKQWAWILANTRSYDPRLGDMGRGAESPILDIAAIIPKLTAAGFVPFRTPGRYGTSATYIPVWGKQRLWFGFVRERMDSGGLALHDVVAFEVPSQISPEKLHELIGAPSFIEPESDRDPDEWQAYRSVDIMNTRSHA